VSAISPSNGRFYAGEVRHIRRFQLPPVLGAWRRPLDIPRTRHTYSSAIGLGTVADIAAHGTDNIAAATRETLDELVEYHELELQLHSVDGGLERPLQVKQARVLYAQEGDVETDDQEINVDEVVKHAFCFDGLRFARGRLDRRERLLEQGRHVAQVLACLPYV
jgi:hypothetical protein